MDKKTIQYNNEVKFEKNKTKDEKLRYLDNRLYPINKKIEKLTQDSFVTQRTINDLSKYSKKSHINELKQLFNKIKNVKLKMLIKFHKQRKKRLEKIFLN